MRILFDLRAYQKYQNRGIGRYIYEVFTRAMRKMPDAAYALIEDSVSEVLLPDDLSKTIRFCTVADFDAGQYPAESFDVLINGAVFQRAGGVSPLTWMYPPAVLSACKHVTGILYDFIPLLFQKTWGSEDDRLLFSLQMEAAGSLSHIFAISRFTLYSGVRYLNRPAEGFTNLYGGADETLFHSPNSALPYDPQSRGNHLIYISGDAVHKNNTGLVQAFCAAHRHKRIPADASLYIVCRASDGMIAQITQETNALGCHYGRDVIVTNYIPDEEMVHLLSSARASIFASIYEGLGLPILESYTAGTPCWASAVSATREFVLPECSFDPFDPPSMTGAIERIYSDADLCARSLAFGRELIQTVNWDTAAEKMLNKLQELAG